MTREEIKEKILDDGYWSLARHRYADLLVENYPDKETLDFLWDLFKKTGNRYYRSLVDEINIS